MPITCNKAQAWCIVHEMVRMDAHISVVLSLVVEGEALSSPLAFIIAATLPIAVHIAPI